METDKDVAKFTIGLVMRHGLEDAKRIINDCLAKSSDEKNINFYTRSKLLAEKLKDLKGGK